VLYGIYDRLLDDSIFVLGILYSFSLLVPTPALSPFAKLFLSFGSISDRGFYVIFARGLGVWSMRRYDSFLLSKLFVHIVFAAPLVVPESLDQTYDSGFVWLSRFGESDDRSRASLAECQPIGDVRYGFVKFTPYPLRNHRHSKRTKEEGGAADAGFQISRWTG